MRVLRLFLGLIFMLMVSVAGAEKTASPQLYKVAKGAIIEVDVPFPGKSTVRFRDGQLLGYFNANTWAFKCEMRFKGTPPGEITNGRYEVTKARNQEISLGTYEFMLNTTLILKTLSGPSADNIQCSQTGSYEDVGNVISPITVQQFKRTVGKHLTLTLKEEGAQ